MTEPKKPFEFPGKVSSPFSDAHYKAIADVAVAIQKVAEHVSPYYQMIHHKYTDSLAECVKLLQLMQMEAK